jgi:hypothetical protein
VVKYKNLITKFYHVDVLLSVTLWYVVALIRSKMWNVKLRANLASAMTGRQSVKEFLKY